MSFGFSAIEMAQVAQYCWRIVQEWKSAPNDFAEIGHIAEALHAVLKSVQVEIDNKESALHRDEKSSPVLKGLVSKVNDVLVDLDAILNHYPSLRADKPQFWERLRFSRGAKGRVMEVRGRMLYYSHLLSALMESVQTGALSRLESIANGQLLHLDGVEKSLEAVFSAQQNTRDELEKNSMELAQINQALQKLLYTIDMLGAEIRESVNPTVVAASNSDDKKVWESLRPRLVTMGFKNETLNKLEDAGVARVRELREEDLLSSEAESDAGSSAGWRSFIWDSDDDNESIGPANSVDTSSSIGSRTSRPYAYSRCQKEYFGNGTSNGSKTLPGKSRQPTNTQNGIKSNASTSDYDSEGTITPTRSTKVFNSERRRGNQEKKVYDDKPGVESREEAPRRSSTYSMSGPSISSSRTLVTESPYPLADAAPRRASETRDRRSSPDTKKRKPIRPPLPPWKYRKQERIVRRFNKGPTDNTDLPDAAAKGDLPEVKALLRSGRNIESNGVHQTGTDNSPPRLTALEKAVAGSRFAVTKFLLENGATVKRDILRHAAKNDDLELTRLLLEYGATTDISSGSAIHIAAHNGNPDMVELLLQYGVDQDCVNIANQSALLLAAESGSYEAVRLLLDQGATPHTLDKDGYTALYKACGKGHLRIVKKLLRAGARVNDGRGRMGDTPLYKAISKGHSDVARELLAYGADPNIANNITSAPDLNNLANLANPRLLWDWMARMNIGDSDTYSPNLGAVIKSYLNKTLDQSYLAIRRAGQYPLHAAAMIGDVEMVALLLEKGAYVNAQDRSGVTAIDAAANSGQREVVDILVHHGAVPPKDLPEEPQEGRSRDRLGLKNPLWLAGLSYLLEKDSARRKRR